jgi:hypothetical protein
MFALAALLCLATGCATTSREVPCLATTRVVSDRAEYKLRRIGVLAFQGPELGVEEGRALQLSILTALSSRTQAELVPLGAADVEEVSDNEPFRRGWTSPETILTLAKRYKLDAIFVGTVTERRSYQPQRLGLEAELISCDTGISIWNSSIQLDAAQDRTRLALKAWFESERASEATNESWELYLLSPTRFAEFGAAQLAMTF